MNKKFFLGLGITTVIFFGILSFLVAQDVFNSYDFDATVGLQRLIPRWFDTFFSSFSLLGSVELTTLILLVLVYLNRKIEGAGVILLFIAVLAIEVLGKFFISHPGPPLSFLRYDIPITLPSFSVHPGSSFPSGHATRTAFLALIIFYMSTRGKRMSNSAKILMLCFMVLLSLIMYISRIYLGEHWLSDVVGGFLLGTGFASLAVLFL